MSNPTIFEIILSGLHDAISQLNDIDVEFSEDYDETLLVDGDLLGHDNCFLVITSEGNDALDVQIHSKEVKPIEGLFKRTPDIVHPWKERQQFELNDPEFFDAVTGHLHGLGVTICSDWHQLP